MKLPHRVLWFAVRALDAISRKEAPFPPERVYLLRTHAIGDVLLTTPTIRAIRKAWPRTHITMLVGRKSRPALEGNPYIDSLESFPEDWWFGKRFGKILKLTWSLRQKPKDALVILHASGLIHLWGFMIGAPIRVGFDEHGSGFALTHPVVRTKKDYDRYLADVNLDLARAMGIGADDPKLDFFPQDDELEAVRAFLPPHDGTGKPFLVGVAPGGGQNAFEKISVKHWPAVQYAELMTRLSKGLNIEFFLLGDKHDVQVDRIAGMAGPGVKFTNLKGRTTFRELGALIYHLDLLVTNDSSPLHLAVAMNKPVVALFGPTANWTLFPPGQNRTALQSPAQCSPCYTYGRFPGCPAPSCMSELPVDGVKDAVESLLNGRSEEEGIAS